jgi:hypothetical protein
MPPLAGDAEDGAAPVSDVGDPFEQSFALATINELDRAVVLDAEARGGVCDGDDGFVWSASHLEEKLVLLRMQACFKRGRFTEEKEAAEFEAKFRQSA